MKSMKFGVCIPNYGDTATLQGIERVAVESEALGYDSIWVTDHILFRPLVGEPYHRIFECLTTLGYLAAVTKRIKLGVSSLIVPMRNPILVAKQLATIDLLSEGRLIVAVAPGWNEREFSELGSDFHNRGRRLDDSIKLLRALWERKAYFHADHIPQNFRDPSFEPRPIQKRLTILIGGNSQAAMKRAATLGDGWHPVGYDLESCAELVTRFRSIPGSKKKEICFRIERDLKSMKTRDWVGNRQPLISGNAEKDFEIVEGFMKLGVSRLLLGPAGDGTVPTQHQVSQLRQFAKKFIGSQAT
jgi:probable F420-dependent oxidoreductase